MDLGIFLFTIDNTIVRLPSLPKNIPTIIIIFPMLLNSDVIPKLNPTVPKADTHSKIIDSKD